MASRACPLCDSPRSRLLVALSPGQYCDPNPTYRRDYGAILGLTGAERPAVVQCVDCALAFAAEVPEPAFLTRLYEDVIQPGPCIAQSEQASEMARRLRYVREFLLLRGGRSPGRALDFGCGTGPTVGLLQAAGFEALGFETSEGRVAHARKAGRAVTSSWEAVKERGVYDLVICDNVLEHLARPLDTLRELVPLLAEGALMYVAVPDYGEPFLNRRLAPARAGELVDSSLNPWEHLSYFSQVTLEALLGRVGLRRVSAAEARVHPDIGLRPEGSVWRRLRNAGFSAGRLARYAVTGRALESPDHAFYALG